MDELVKMVAKKVGITDAQAKEAVKVVIDFLKQKLPAPVAGQIDGLLGGADIGGIAKSLGGVFGKKG